MDLAKELKDSENGYSLKLTSRDEAEMLAYISTVLELHAKSELLHESAIDRVMTLCVLINTGNRQELSRTLHAFNNGGNWPSTTRNPSGGGRGNL
ncbi:hypothetical protein PHDIMM138B_26915 [Phytobacter diazotrophicus]